MDESQSPLLSEHVSELSTLILLIDFSILLYNQIKLQHMFKYN